MEHPAFEKLKHHKCAMCGKITDNFNDAVNHALSHVTVARSYSFRGFHVCPLCSHCFDHESELQECMNQHLQTLVRMGYVIIGDPRNSADTIQQP